MQQRLSSILRTSIFTSPLISLGILIMTSTYAHAAQILPERVISPKHKIEAWLIASKFVPMISMSFTFKGGAAYDPADKAGLTQFTTALLDEGCGEMDAEAFHKQIEENAVNINFSADYDRIGGAIQVINEHRDEGFRLLKLALSKPRFDKNPFDRIKKQSIVAIERKREEPDDLAADALQKTVFGNHPYAVPQSGRIESVTSITIDDCKNLIRERFVRDGLIISVAGDITSTELGTKLDELFGDFPEKSNLKDLPEPTLNLKGDLQIIALQDRPQTVALFAHQGLKRSDPDFYAAYILNQIVGGSSFSARLMDEVRTKRGLTYGIGTQLTWNEKAAYTAGSSSTDNKRFKESLAIIKEVYKKVAETGPTAEELQAAKDYLTGSFALMMDSTANLAQLLSRIQKDKLPIDFLSKRNDYIRNVTLEQIKATAKKLFSGDNLTCVAAGNPA